MAKNSMAFSATGKFDGDAMLLTEEKKDAINVFDLRKVLAKFSGYDKVKISVGIEDSFEEFLVDVNETDDVDEDEDEVDEE